MPSNQNFKIASVVWLLPLLRSAHASEYDKLISAAQEAKHNLPAPTPAPLLVRDVRNRQVTSSSSTTFTITKVSDSTCGFLSGSPGNAITCENKAPCTWEAEHISNIICGLTDDEGTKLRCFDREEVINPSVCNDVCQSNTYNLLCTNTASPYCRTYAYPSGVRDYRCAATPVSGVQSVLHTYNNQNDRTLTTSILGGDILNAETSQTRTPFASSTSTPVNPTSILTVVPTQTAPPSEGNGTPVGPIVGGVIGGLAVIGLFFLGFFFLRRKKSNQNPQSAPHAVPYTFGPGGLPLMQQQMPVSPTSTHDPTFKGGNISVMTSPGSAQTPEEYARLSQAYSMTGAPPNYQLYQQGQGQGMPIQVPLQSVSPDLPVVYEHPASVHHIQGVHEIGTVQDQHRGRMYEVS